MNNDLEIDKILEVDSKFIESLCQQLEKDGIHLTNQLLVEILSKYENQKLELLKGVIEQIANQEGITLNEAGGPSIIQVVVDGNRNKEDEDDLMQPNLELDSKYLN